MSSVVNDSIMPTNERETVSGAILTATISLIVVLSWLFIKNSKKWSNKIAPLPPGPRGLPILGYLPFIGTQLHKKFTELAEIHGPIYMLQLGNKLCLVVSSPSLAKEIVRDQDTVFANRDPPIAVKVVTYGGIDIGWSDNGPVWKKMRKLFVREMMSNTNIDACYGLRRQEVRKTIREVYNKTGKPIDIGELAFLTNMNATMNMLWGATLEGEEGVQAGIEFRKLVAELMVLVGKPNISDYFPVLAKLDLQGIERQAKKFTLVYEKFLDSAVTRCEALIEASKGGNGEKNDKRKDFLRLLLELKDHKDDATSISMIQLKAMLADVVVGGSDTTSTMVEWTMAELMNHPEIMKNVHQELDEVVGLDNIVEESHVPKLRYLDAVVKETFRLHPALPFLVPRRPSKTTAIGGYTIPKGTTVFLNVYAIHRDPGSWENPLEFLPERFLNIGETSNLDFSGNNFRFLPFGSGRRICAGFPLAEKMLIYQLASLLHSFEWKLPSDSKLDLSDNFGLLVKILNPLIGIPTPRLANSDLYSV